MANIIRPKETWKNNIIKPDPHLAAYIYEKQVNPDHIIVLKQYERRLVDAVDRIIELAHGNRETVRTEEDWKVVEELFKFFASEWPREYAEFKQSIGSIRDAKGEGYSKTREIRHVGSLPPRFEKMIKVIFPYQQWDKEFVNKFVKKFPLFKVGETKK